MEKSITADRATNFVKTLQFTVEKELRLILQSIPVHRL